MNVTDFLIIAVLFGELCLVESEYHVATEGDEIEFFLDGVSHPADIKCSRKGEDLAIGDQFKIRPKENGTSLVIVKVGANDIGEYQCTDIGTGTKKRHKLFVVGPIDVQVKKFRNRIDVTCEVKLNVHHADSQIRNHFYFGHSVDGGETSELQLSDDFTESDLAEEDAEPLPPEEAYKRKDTLDFVAYLDSKKLHNVSCTLRFQLSPFSVAVTKEVNMSYELEVVVAFLSEDAIFQYNRPIPMNDFECNKLDFRTERSRLIKVPSENEGAKLILTRTASGDYGDYVCRDVRTGEYVIYELVIIDSLKLDVTRSKNRLIVKCTSIAHLTISPLPDNLHLKILVNSREVTKGLVGRKSSAEYNGDLDKTIKTHRITCAVTTEKHSKEITKEIDISDDPNAGESGAPANEVDPISSTTTEGTGATAMGTAHNKSIAFSMIILFAVMAMTACAS